MIYWIILLAPFSDWLCASWQLFTNGDLHSFNCSFFLNFVLSCNLIMRSYKLAGILLTNAVGPPLRQSIQLTHWTRHHRLEEKKNSNAWEKKKVKLKLIFANSSWYYERAVRRWKNTELCGAYSQWHLFHSTFFVPFLVRNFDFTDGKTLCG